MSSEKLRFALHSVLYNYIGKIFLTIFNFATFVIVIQALNVEDYGKYTFYTNAIFFGVIFLDFGATEVALRYIPEFLKHNEIHKIKDIVKRITFIVSTASFTLWLIMHACLIIFPSFSSKFAIVRVLPYIILFSCAKIYSIVFGNILNAFFFQAYRIGTETVSSLIRLILIYSFIRKGASVWNIIVIYALTDLMLAGLSYLKVRNYLNIPTKLKDKEHYKKIFRFGIGEFFYKLFWFFTDNRFDVYLAGIFLGMKEAGYLAFAAGIINLLVDWSPGLIIRPIIAPIFAREYAGRRNSSRVEYLFQFHNKFLMFVSLPFFVLMAVFIDKLIIFAFDPKYLPSVQVFLILIVSMCLLNIVIPLRNIIFLIERPGISNISNITALPKVIMIYLFAKTWGIKGIALIYTFCLLLTVVVNVVLIKKIINIRYPWWAFAKIIFNCAVMAVALFYLKGFVVNKLSLLIVALAGMTVYLAAAHKNRAFNSSDRDFLNKILGANVWVF